MDPLFAPASEANAPPRSAPRLSVGVISSGKVGAVLGAALDRVGHRVTAVSAPSAQARARAAELLPQARVTTPDDVAASTQLLLLTVPDYALPELADRLPFRAGHIVLHTSGAYGVGVLSPARRVGALVAAAHPAMTFLGTTDDLGRLARLPWAVTAQDEASLIAEALIAEIDGVAEHVSEEQRPLYHASLAHAANHLVTLINDASEELARAGIGDTSSYLRRLVNAAVDNAVTHGDDGLTGPVVRGDADTVARHLSVVDDDKHDSYRALANRTVERARKSGRLTEREYDRVREVLLESGDPRRVEVEGTP
ncbi:Rossmann-like and DUF2520 domain-containing protein [Haloglycomyces albus]|uniref:Rossmann-like and DUF2520 domain-containing protein n=1 Tax=Haloglycomyces albus TaxID=526067 RepID=UPI00046D3074|nr:DUF2520 domain-containing protein [Haloglycomyces albus]